MVIISEVKNESTSLDATKGNPFLLNFRNKIIKIGKKSYKDECPICASVGHLLSFSLSIYSYPFFYFKILKFKLKKKGEPLVSKKPPKRISHELQNHGDIWPVLTFSKI